MSCSGTPCGCQERGCQANHVQCETWMPGKWISGNGCQRPRVKERGCQAMDTGNGYRVNRIRCDPGCQGEIWMTCSGAPSGGGSVPPCGCQATGARQRVPGGNSE